MELRVAADRCDAVAFLGVARFEDELVFHRVVADTADLSFLNGTKPLEGSFARPSPAATRADAAWSPTKVPSWQRQRFVTMREIVDEQEVRNTAHWQMLHEPFEIVDQARVLLHDGRQLCGWLGVVRRGNPSLTIEPPAVERMNAALARVSARLIAAERLAAELVEPAAYVVLDMFGLPVYWTRPAHQALGGFDALLDAFGGWTSEPHHRMFAGYHLAVSPLNSEGPSMTLITLSAPEVVRRCRQQELTPLQRRILAWIIAGFSNAEIAEHCGLSQSGAKYHVASLCAHLEVESRHDLARVTGGNA